MAINDISINTSTSFGFFDTDYFNLGNNIRGSDDDHCILDNDSGRIEGMSDIYLLDFLCSDHQKEFELLKEEINETIMMDKRADFDKLSDENKDKLVGLLIKALNDQSSWIVECKDADMAASSLASFMIDLSPDSSEYFLSVIRTNAIKHWGKHLQNLFYRELQEIRADERLNYLKDDEFPGF